MRDDLGFMDALVEDGRPLVTLTGVALALSGGFALCLSVARQFLPHDLAFLGMTADTLCEIGECRVASFMFHDRVAFGGVLIAIGVIYLWLAEFPLRRGEPWAWWALALSGATGFSSFLAYLGYGYLDSWHGTATLFLLPTFVAGLWLSHRRLRRPRGWRTVLVPGWRPPWRSADGMGRGLLLLTALGMVGAGSTILGIGMTSVFVPQDLAFMRLTAEQLHAVNPRLVPLIAHDRAGFGGGLLSCGLALGLAVWCGRPSRSLWQAVAIAGFTGFGCAIGIHLVVGYVDAAHLAPALLGAALFATGLVASSRAMLDPVAAPRPDGRWITHRSAAGTRQR